MGSNKLRFYTVDLNYVSYLQQTEKNIRGFTRVPNMDYGTARKRKFICGVVLNIHNKDYYVPVSSYKQQQHDNFLIKIDNGKEEKVVSSLRFNYMFPVPKNHVHVCDFNAEPDMAYRSLVTKEWIYCVKNQKTIQRLAERTYHKVLQGKDNGLITNSCAFLKLESAMDEYILQQNQ